MSFHPLKGQDGREKELVEAPVQGMGKLAAVDTRDRNHVRVEGFGPALKAGRCRSIGAFQNGVSKILFEKNTVL